MIEKKTTTEDDNIFRYKNGYKYKKNNKKKTTKKQWNEKKSEKQNEIYQLKIWKTKTQSCHFQVCFYVYYLLLR